MPKDELEALTADIKSNGLLNPIIRCDGKIVDGRNRLLACRAAEVEPRFRDISQNEANIWAKSQNIFRRSILPEEQVFALQVLSSADEPIVGKKRIKAYHKLKKLKEELTNLTERAKNGENVIPELEALLRRKVKTVEIKSIFQILADKLHCFRTSHSDGVEHKFILEMEQAIIIFPKNETEMFYKKELKTILLQLSNSFSNYAKQL